MKKEIPICPVCKKNTREVNYYRKGKTYYRARCKSCEDAAKYKQSLPITLLAQSKYSKKKCCDRCKFISKHPSQMEIYYLDHNVLNTHLTNLRTYCLNCIAELKANPYAKSSDLVLDY